MVKPSAPPMFSSGDDEDSNVQTFCKQMLKQRMFRGFYQERRYVSDLNSYRDLVIIENSETALKTDLKYIKTRVQTHYKNENLWVGISLPDMIGAPAAGLCIWTEIEDLAFGEYWFIIKTVEFRQDEVIVKLKHVRSTEETSQKQSYTNEEESITLQSITELIKSAFHSCKDDVIWFLNAQITKANIIATIKFLTVLVLSILTASVEAAKYFIEYSLKFSKEFRLLMHTMMPLFLKVVDLFQKVIGAFFILIAMIIREIFGSKTTQIPQFPMIEGSRPNYKGGITSNSYTSPYNDYSRRNRRN